MTYHLVIDRTTGELRVRGRDGRDYRPAQLEGLEARAKAGDPDAIADLENLRMPEIGPEAGPEGVPAFQHMLDSCPECQAERARGIAPVVGVPPQTRKPRGVDRFRRPRWRYLKRIAGRDRP